MKDEEIVEVLRSENEEFRRLFQEHKELDVQLQDLGKKAYLSPEEEIEEKRMKKEKLSRKDRIAQLIRDYRKTHSVN